jgi:hypothetical protein
MEGRPDVWPTIFHEIKKDSFPEAQLAGRPEGKRDGTPSCVPDGRKAANERRE